MAATIRLTRMGRRKRPFYRIVVMDSRKRRDGKYIESLGYYNPMATPSLIEINEDLARKWINNGATMSDTVRNLMSKKGILLKMALDKSSADDERKTAIIADWEQKNNKRIDKLRSQAAAPQAEMVKEQPRAEEPTAEVATEAANQDTESEA